MANHNAIAGVDNITQPGSDDTVTVTNSNQIEADDFFNGGDGLDTIVVSTLVNLSTIATDATHGFHNYEALDLSTGAATFNAVQFGAGLIANTLAIKGTNGTLQSIQVNNASNFSAAGWTFTSWETTDFIIIGGSLGSDTLTGSSQNDFIAGGPANDIINGGLGADRAVYVNVAQADLTIQRVDSGTWTITDNVSGQGTDTLVNIESLFFTPANVEVSLADLIGLLNDTNPAINSVAERAVTGTAVGITGHAVDGSFESVSYSLTNNAGGRFQIDASTGVVTVANGLLIDFETATSHSITVRATSADGSLTDKVFTVGVSNVSPETIIGTAAANTLVGGNDKDLIFGLGGNDKLIGGGNNDTLTGAAGADILTGGLGVDTLNGGFGRDIMTGNAQRDVFDFNLVAETGKTPFTRDVIKDFTHFQGDDIDLSTIDAKAGPLNQAFSFIGQAAFSGVKGQLHYKFEGPAKTIVEGDIDGNKVADFQIELTGHKVLVGGDFIL